MSHPNEIQNTFEGTKDYESITEVYESKNLYVRTMVNEVNVFQNNNTYGIPSYHIKY